VVENLLSSGIEDHNFGPINLRELHNLLWDERKCKRLFISTV